VPGWPIYGNSPVEAQIAGFEVTSRPGWRLLRGRISAGACLLSTEFQGEVFAGDDLSPVLEPILSIGVLGSNDRAQPIHMMMAGRLSPGQTPAIKGTISFSAGADSPAPCAMKNLVFQLEPVEVVVHSSY
jgi:hypothetical protein